MNLTAVEVMGRYSNHADQGDRIGVILDHVPGTPRRLETSTTKQVFRRLGAAEIADLRRAYLDGASTYALADAVGIHRHTIAAHLKNSDVAMRRRSLTPEEVQEAAALYASGLSLVDVAERIGRRRTGVANALRKAGVQFRPRPGWRY